jgi:hypothetical protein
MSSNPLLGCNGTLYSSTLDTYRAIWWSQTGSNRRPPACKAGALPTELWPLQAAGTRGHGCRRPEIETHEIETREIETREIEILLSRSEYLTLDI